MLTTLTGDLRTALDPALLGERCGLVLDPWQAKLVRERPRRALLNCSRQSGKTTTATLLALWTALYEAPALTLIVSPSQRQSGEVFRTFMGHYRHLDDAPPITAESALRVEFKNGSRVIALPGSERTTRGYAGAKMVVLDEASRVEDDLMAALRPTMATVNGSLVALSTPNGKRGWWYEAWVSDEPWVRVRVPASECPRLSRSFLDEEKRALGPMLYSQEYELQFVDDCEAVWSTEIIDRAFTDDVRAIWQ